MRLLWAEIHGFRRFGGPDPHRLRLDTSIVCLVGANEAGKTSILDALGCSLVEEAVESTDRSRRESVPDSRRVVRLCFRIEDTDAAVLDDLQSGNPRSRPQARLFYVAKHASGAVRTGVHPPLERDLRPRRRAATVLRTAVDTGVFQLEPDQVDSYGPTVNRLADLVVALAGEADSLEGIDVSALRELAEFADENDHPRLGGVLRDAHDAESDPHPNEEAARRLHDRVPKFVRFTDAARVLHPEYDLQMFASTPPEALANLAGLANLQLDELLQAVQSEESGTVQTIIEAANAELERVFAAWTQQPKVRVAFDTSGTFLLIHVQSGSGSLMRINERSDGLRQFVALVALTAQSSHTVKPALLIDEAEMHLHYDAQADLMRLLAEQDGVSQVVYTTHSAGCLPEDLGASVRVIEGVGSLMTSRIRNSFWTDDPGLGPLLLAMGAASLAFLPLRPAVIGEGPTEVVLLPTLLKAAIGREHLGYQVAPGAAGVRPAHIAAFDLQAPQTAWVVDNDAGGLAIRDKLIQNDIPKSRILIIGERHDHFCIEDFLAPEAYLEAVKLYLRDVAASEFPSLSDIREGARHESVEEWTTARGIRTPSKPAIANKLLELRGFMPLLSGSAPRSLRAIHDRIEGILGLRKAAPAEPPS